MLRVFNIQLNRSAVWSTIKGLMYTLMCSSQFAGALAAGDCANAGGPNSHVLCTHLPFNSGPLCTRGLLCSAFVWTWLLWSGSEAATLACSTSECLSQSHCGLRNKLHKWKWALRNNSTFGRNLRNVKFCENNYFLTMKYYSIYVVWVQEVVQHERSWIRKIWTLVNVETRIRKPIMLNKKPGLHGDRQ